MTTTEQLWQEALEGVYKLRPRYREINPRGSGFGIETEVIASALLLAKADALREAGDIIVSGVANTDVMKYRANEHRADLLARAQQYEQAAKEGK